MTTFELQYINDETGEEFGKLFKTQQAADDFIAAKRIKDHQIMYYGWSE
jgi:hypothetical protein